MVLLLVFMQLTRDLFAIAKFLLFIDFVRRALQIVFTITITITMTHSTKIGAETYAGITSGPTFALRAQLSLHGHA